MKTVQTKKHAALITEEHLNFCENEKETLIIKERIHAGSNNATAKSLNSKGIQISRRTVDKIVNKILEKENLEKARANESNLIIKGTSTLYDKDGNVKLKWVKTDLDKNIIINHVKNILSELIEELRSEREKLLKLKDDYNNSEEIDKLLQEYGFIKKEKIAEKHRKDNDIIVVYPIGDLHLGMFSWSDETGEDYDLKIAENLILKSFEKMILSAPDSSKVLLANLGDFFHVDDTRNETLKSHNKLDVDSRYPKILKTGLKIIINIIQKLLDKHDEVIIRNAIGNHDPHTTFFLNEYIRAWFNNDPRIIIEDDQKTFWFYKFGKNLFGITHGDTCKITDLPEIMASDAAEHWSSTEFRYWLIGHVHHFQTKEFRTCYVESFGTLAAKDQWHYSKGYRSHRNIKFKVYHKDYGEIQEGTISLPMILDEKGE